jgi:hypothetical protein
MKISYKPLGRFGNNLFQYIALKLVQHEVSKKDTFVEYVYNTPLENAFVVTDDNFFEILKDVSPLLNKNVYLDGYFQFDTHIIKNKDYINTVINSYNSEYINNHIKVSFLANQLSQNKYEFNLKEYILHLRLDDFIGDRIVMKPDMYIDIISSLPEGTSLIIVVDKLKAPWEIEYVRMIHEYATKVKGMNVTISSDDDMFKDFCKLYYSENLISSNSTFSYLAGLLGTHKYTWCPVNTIYSHQKISKFDENTVSKEVEYI